MDPQYQKKESKINGNSENKLFSVKSILRISTIIIIGLSVYLFISAIVIVFLTKPDKEVVVPNVIGKQFMNVYNSLIRKELKPELKFINTHDLDNGVILNQYPESGVIVNEGSKINILVARGSNNITVPNLIGLKLPFAINKLKNIHIDKRSYTLSVGAISYIPSDKIKDSIIIDHSPGGDEEVTPDRKINLLVSAGKISPGMKMPRVTGQYIDLCFDLLLAKGVYIYEKVEITDKKWKSGVIKAQKPGPGESIFKQQTVKLEVYYYQRKEHPYISYERVTYQIPSDEEKGLYEVIIEDNRARRTRYSRIVKPNRKIDLVFKRKGNAKISITKNKEIIEKYSIDIDNYY